MVRFKNLDREPKLDLICDKPSEQMGRFLPEKRKSGIAGFGS